MKNVYCKQMHDFILTVASVRDKILIAGDSLFSRNKRNGSEKALDILQDEAVRCEKWDNF